MADAVMAAARHGMSFWDGMTWSIAKRHGVAEILSEDLQGGREVEGVFFTNPF